MTNTLSPSTTSPPDAKRPRKPKRHWLEYAGVAGACAAAIGTFVTAGVGIWQGDISDKSAKRQLRAYVFIPSEGNNLGIGPNNRIFTHIKFKNFGTTPAHDFYRWACAAVADEPLRTALMDRPEIRPSSTVIVAPQDFTNMIGDVPICDSSGHRELTAQEKEAVEKGTKAAYIHGEARYRDVFGELRWTRFRAFTKWKGSPFIEFPADGNSYY